MAITTFWVQKFGQEKMKKFRCINFTQDGLFRGCSQMGGGGLFGPPPQNLSHISYDDETWYGYTLPREDPKNM